MRPLQTVPPPVAWSVCVKPGRGASRDEVRAAIAAPTQVRAAITTTTPPTIFTVPVLRDAVPACLVPSLSGRVRSAAPATTAAKAATRATPRTPGGSGSPKTVMPAAIGNAFVQRVARPTVVSALPRWNPSCRATNARPWHASRAGMNATCNPPETAAFVPTSPAA